MAIDAEKAVFSPQAVSSMAVRVIEDRTQNPRVGVKTGIEALDKTLNPHRPGELRVVLGYTSNYKTGLMNYIARNAAREIAERGDVENRVIISVTWEQSVEEQGITDLAQMSHLDVTKMMRGEMTDKDWQDLKRAAIKRGVLPWWLIGHSSETSERRPRLSMEDVYNAIVYLIDVQQVEPELISLDYLQRIRRTGQKDTRIQFMDIVDLAKDMALKLHVPVMLGSQAGRQVKTRAWRLPQPDDGQETSNLEQSADSILSVWLPKNDYPLNKVIEYGDMSIKVTDNLMILGIMKQKFGVAPRLYELHVKHEINEIYGVRKDG